MMALYWRDLLVASRSGGGLGLSILFFLLVMALVPLGLGGDPGPLLDIWPGIIWIAAMLSSLLTLDRVLLPDFEDGTLDSLAASGFSLEVAVAVKSLAHWTANGLPIALATPLAALLYGVPPAACLWSMCALLAGSPALSFTGAFCASLTLTVKRGGLLLSLLALPLHVPTLLLGSGLVIRHNIGLDVGGSLALLLAVSLISAAMSPFFAAAALRAAMR